MSAGGWHAHEPTARWGSIAPAASGADIARWADMPTPSCSRMASMARSAGVALAAIERSEDDYADYVWRVAELREQGR
jgi:hypothetical protein